MHRTLAALTLVAFLGTTPPSLLDQIWSLLSSFWSSETVDGDEGIGWDPNGATTPPKPQSDEGIGWDPNGGQS